MSEPDFSRSYQPTVRLGNWFENLCQEQARIRDFEIMRENGDLLVEKGRVLYDKFHKAAELEAPKDHIRIGAVIQVVPAQMNQCPEEDAPDVRPVLSIVINEHVVRTSQGIDEHCELTIAPSMESCVRNSFKLITGNDLTPVGKDEVLKYGQLFRLQCVDQPNDPLLLYTAQKSLNLTNVIRTTFQSIKLGEINLPLGLIRRRHVGPGKTIPTAFTNWFCVHHDPNKRFETEGLPIPSSTPTVITHQATNRNLAVERICVQTLFGPEFLVSVQNYKSVNGKEGWQNIWILSSGRISKPGKDTCKPSDGIMLKTM